MSEKKTRSLECRIFIAIATTTLGETKAKRLSVLTSAGLHCVNDVLPRVQGAMERTCCLDCMYNQPQAQDRASNLSIEANEVVRHPSPAR